MKYTSICFALGLIFLAVLSTQAHTDFIGSNTVRGKKQSEIFEMYGLKLDMIKAIVNDNEYLSLKPRRQLRIFVAVYNILENFLKTQN